MSSATEAVVDDATDFRCEVASDVVSQKEMGQEKVATTGMDGSRLGIDDGRSEHCRMSAHGKECADAPLGKELLMDQV